MFKFLQILVINLPLVFGTSGILAPSGGLRLYDKIMTRDGNDKKNVATGTTSHVIDSVFKNTSNPFIRDLFIKFLEKRVESLEGNDKQ